MLLEEAGSENKKKGDEKNEKDNITFNEPAAVFDAILGSADRRGPGGDCQNPCRDHQLLPYDISHDSRRRPSLVGSMAQRKRRQYRRLLRLLRSQSLERR